MEPAAEQPPARFVRQFALTKGRARSVGKELAMDTLVRATDLGLERRDGLVRDRQQVLDLCRETISVAEIGALLHVHLGIARVLVSDMVAHQLVTTSSADFDEDGPDLGILERLLDDLQAL